MIKKTNSFFKLSLFLGLVFTLSFYACQQEDQLTPTIDKVEQGIFEKHSADNSQLITAQDLGEGTYSVTGDQGTVISLNNALINKNGERVRGAIQIELVEIYSVGDMILKRKQTVADYDGVNKILESGGELFINAFQNGEELTLDGRGETQVLLPTANTGGAKEDMELFYGEIQGEQIIWKPTGQKIEVISSIEREEQSYYMMVLETTLGWVNVDKIYAAGGDPVECIEVKIDCPEICQPNITTVAMHVNGQNVGVELTDIGGGVYQFCGIEGEGAVPLGGITVTFIVIVECEDGTLMVAFVSATINAGYHVEYIDCEPFKHIQANELEDLLQQLN